MPPLFVGMISWEDEDHYRQDRPCRHPGALAGLSPGTELDVTMEHSTIRLVRAVPGPKLVRVGNRLVARPTVPVEERTEVDVAGLIEEERDRWPL